MLRPFAPFVLSLFLVACVRLDPRGFDQSRLCEDLRSPGRIISLPDYTQFEWEHLFVFGPQASREAIARVSGTRVPFPHKELETHCLLVFLRADKVAAAFEEARSEVDFIALTRPEGFARSEARFRGDKSVNGIKLKLPDGL